MPDAKNTTALIIGRGLLSGEAIAQELRARLVSRMLRDGWTQSDYKMLQIARDTLAEFEPLLAQSLFDSELAAWVAGLNEVAMQLPTWAQQAIAGGQSLYLPSAPLLTPRDLPPQPPIKELTHPDDEPVVRFPMIEKAAQSLAERRIVLPEEFKAMAAEVKQTSFTVAGVNSAETLEKIRDVLAETVEEGASLKVFREKLAEAIDTSSIGPAHQETIFRTNVMTAFNTGKVTLAENPIVAELFPYRAWDATHDARVRPEHKALETYGIEGTNIYRAADPMWQVFGPPFEWKCRCSTVYVTIENAARKGLQEAKRWQETGMEPQWETALIRIPFRPSARWTGRTPARAA